MLAVRADIARKALALGGLQLVGAFRHAVAVVAAPVGAHQVARRAPDADGARATRPGLAGAGAVVQAAARLAALLLVVDQQAAGVGVEIGVVGAVAPAGDGVARAGIVARGRGVAVTRATAHGVGIKRRLARELARPRGVILDAVARFAQGAAPGVGARARGDAARHRAGAVVLARAVLAPATG